MPALIGLTGEYGGKTFILDGERFTMGRSEENDMPLEDSLVSSVHCSIELEADGWMVHDQESTNGSYLNGDEISKTSIDDQDVLTLGNTKFRFVMDASASALIESSEPVDDDPVPDFGDAAPAATSDDFDEYLDADKEGFDFETWLSTPSKNNTLLAMLSVGFLFIVMLLFFTQVT